MLNQVENKQHANNPVLTAVDCHCHAGNKGMRNNVLVISQL